VLDLSVLLENAARNHPDRLAVALGDTRLTYAQLDAAASQVANALMETGVGHGDRVAVLIPNTPHFPIVYFGILKAGAIVVPLNVLLKGPEVAYHLEDSGARVLIAFEGFAEAASAGFAQASGCEALWFATVDAGSPPPMDGEGISTLGARLEGQSGSFDTFQTMPDDTAVLLYTSGTTGRPKGAELSHSNMVLNAIISRDLVGATADDRALCVLPLFHSFGQTCVQNASILTGGALILLPRFEPERALELMAREKVTLFAGVPTMYWSLLHSGNREAHAATVQSNLRGCTSGGAAMPVELMRSFEEAFGVTILEGYGLSETAPVATFNVSAERRKPGSIGLPVWGVDVRIVDERDHEVARGERGEIVLRGHNVMKGYWQRPEDTAAAMRGGWFHTGDVAYMDEDGYTFIVDRKKDMIIRGGFNVYPREIEEVLMTHPAVSLCAVIGVPDEKLGEEVKAFVVPRDGVRPDPEDVIGWCRERMAAYKYPRTVELRDALPMTATGKILKRELR
jgi:long-chain acyl-CoA synthetase